MEPSLWYREFEKVKLKCPIEGIPIPYISWYLNSNLLDLNSNDQFKIDPDTSSLTISELKTSLQGLYSCNGTNEFGTEIYRHQVEIACK